MFAFMPVQKATTVHTGIQSSIDIQDIFADTTGVAAGGNAAIIVDVLVVRHDGTPVTGLATSAFTASVQAGSTLIKADATPFVITFAQTGGTDDVGNGVYRLSVDPDSNWAALRTDIRLTVTSGGISATALVVITL